MRHKYLAAFVNNESGKLEIHYVDKIGLLGKLLHMSVSKIINKIK